MSDFLLELSANPQIRRLVQSAGLPLPMPAQLERTTEPRAERPLERATAERRVRVERAQAVAYAQRGVHLAAVLPLGLGQQVIDLQ